MKKTFLRSAAIAVAVTGASAAHAVHVNPDGLGQVLLYPYYTVQNDFVTAIHVVNTTDQVKAVKVRFLEGKNSQEVLDFNLYLSPKDVWTGTVVPDATNGAKLISSDTSCIAPAQVPAGGQPFRNFQFADEDAPVDLDRRREGYVEIIEMGEIGAESTLGVAATHLHPSDIPDDCAAIRAADKAVGEGSMANFVSAPNGGLFGSGHLVSVNGGVRTSYDPTALDGFADKSLWSEAGDTLPSLAEVSPPIANIFDGTSVYEFNADALSSRGIDAVSAVLTLAEIDNEYTIDAGRESQTDWIVTFPTKRFYVNSDIGPSPFQEMWDSDDRESCHQIGIKYWNREEAVINPEPTEADWSPLPPPDEVPVFELCNEVNTLTLYRAGTDPLDGRLFEADSTYASLGIEDFSAGWLQMSFGTGTDYGSISGLDASDAPITLTGLPVVGFSASRNVNKVSVVVDGLTVYSAVMGSNVHKGSKDINL